MQICCILNKGTFFSDEKFYITIQPDIRPNQYPVQPQLKPFLRLADNTPPSMLTFNIVKCLPPISSSSQAEEFALNVWHKFQSWKVVGFSNLPQWLQDNDFLRKGHRPPLPSFRNIVLSYKKKQCTCHQCPYFNKGIRNCISQEKKNSVSGC